MGQAVLVLAVIGALLGALLGIADRFLKVENDPREDEVLSKLAGANCGGCGFPGCAGFAHALVSGEVDTVGKCRPTSPANKQAIVEYLTTTPGPDGKTLKVKV